MKVLMTADAVSGVWTHVMELCRGLESRGAQVLLATMGPPPRWKQRAEAMSLPNVQLRVSSFDLEWMDNPWSDVDRSGRWLLDLATEFEPDVVHLSGFSHAALPWTCPVMIVAQSCVLTWWQAVNGVRAPSACDEYRRRITRGLECANLLIAPTASMLSAMSAELNGLPSHSVILNGRSAGQFSRGEKESIVFSVGRLWDEAKNVGALECVAPLVRWPVFIAGERKIIDGIPQKFLSVRTLGHLDADMLSSLFSRAAIFALPVRYEPFGFSILEAALSECALVLGDIPSMRELWDDCAVFVNPMTPNDLLDAINDVIADKDLLTSLASAARERASRYSADAMTTKYLTAYRGLLA